MLKNLDTKKLLRLHDTLNKALGQVYETLGKDGFEAPAWLDEAAADVREMYDEIWARRERANPSRQEDQDEAK